MDRVEASWTGGGGDGIASHRRGICHDTVARGSAVYGGNNLGLRGSEDLQATRRRGQGKLQLRLGSEDVSGTA